MSGAPGLHILCRGQSCMVSLAIMYGVVANHVWCRERLCVMSLTDTSARVCRHANVCFASCQCAKTLFRINQIAYICENNRLRTANNHFLFVIVRKKA